MAGTAPPKKLPPDFRIFKEDAQNPDWVNKIIADPLKPTAEVPFDADVLIPDYRKLSNIEFQQYGHSKRVIILPQLPALYHDALPRSNPACCA